MVLEDNAQGCGGSYKGKKLGTFGDMGIFSFDYVKTVTTGEGGMVVTDNEDLYNRAEWYHDHGHDHNPNVGRAMEGRSIVGFNYRMGELQGAVGLAQLRRLDYVIAEQKKSKAIVREALSEINGVKFRDIPDPEGDTATFLGFNFPEAEITKKFQKALSDEGIDTVLFKENLWHYVPNWEHFLSQSTANSKKYPFSNPMYKGKVNYSTEDIPQAEDIMGRTLIMPISVRMPEEKMKSIVGGIEKAAGVIREFLFRSWE
jgi:8-amino-3,8-dideoxy-alpha-D-manno-octulosonate transaminase